MENNQTIEKLAKALGHMETPNTRCLAVHKKPENLRPGWPAGPPTYCTLKKGHEGPHIQWYGTQRITLRPELTVDQDELPSTCSKCRTLWPCEDVKTITDVINAHSGPDS